MDTRDRLMSRRGNVMLVSGSIYQACKLYEMFSETELAGKCAIITSYRPAPGDIRTEETGAGLTEKLHQYEVYRQMLADFFEVSEEAAVNRAEEFEQKVKQKFVDEPGQMRLLIVVDKLLTGFDAPPATYLYMLDLYSSISSVTSNPSCVSISSREQGFSSSPKLRISISRPSTTLLLPGQMNGKSPPLVPLSTSKVAGSNRTSIRTSPVSSKVSSASPPTEPAGSRKRSLARPRCLAEMLNHSLGSGTYEVGSNVTRLLLKFW
jgi:hypothetical protein